MRPEASAGIAHDDDRHVSFVRGVLCALPNAAIGFVVPYVALAALSFVRSASAIDRDADLRELPIKALGAAIGCAVVFALAAVLNHSPARKLGFIRALLPVALSALFGVFVTDLATDLLHLHPRTYHSDPFGHVRCAIGVTVTVVLTLLILQRVIHRQNQAE